jgi:hypothetical protein
MSDQSAVPGKPSLAARIDREKSQPLAWKTIATRAAMAVIAGLAIYLVFPAITEVLASWPRLSTLNPWWLIAAVAAEVAHFTCTFAWRLSPSWAWAACWPSPSSLSPSS